MAGIDTPARDTADAPARRFVAFVAPFAGSALFGGLEGCGGSERQLVLVGKSLADRGWEVHFVIAPWSGDRRHADPRFAIREVPFRYLGGRKAHMLADGIPLHKALAATRAPIVILRAGGLFVLLPLLFLRRIQGTSLVIWVQHDHDVVPGLYYPHENTWLRRTPKWLYERVVGWADLVVVQTERQREAVARTGRRCPLLIRNLAGSLWPTARPPEPTMDGDPYVFWAGNTSQNKRLGIVLDVAGRLPQVRFVVAMNPGGGGSLEAQADQAKAVPNVEFLGTVPARDIEDWFRRARLVLNTSAAEGFSNSLLQAWSAGVPVVTAGVDPDGVIRKRGLGKVVEIGSGAQDKIEDLAAAIQGMLMDEPGWRAASARCRAHVEAHHDPAPLVDELEGALRLLIGR